MAENGTKGVGRLRRWLVGILALLMLAGLGMPVGAAGGGGAAGEQAASSAAVRVHIRAAAAERAQLMTEFGVRHDFTDLGLGFTADVPVQALAGLQRRPGVQVERVAERRVLGAAAPAGKGNGNGKGKPPKGGGRTAYPSDQTPWGIETIYNNTGIAATGGGGGIVVAVLDTGVAAHIDLRSPGQCKDFTKSRRGQPFTDNSCSDGHGHGTHVTGTIAAYGGSDGLGIYGVAPDVTYWSYKICGNNGLCWSDDVAAAIRHATDQGAHILSMSIGGSTASDLERQAVQYAAARGALLIAAAGNSGPNPDTIGYPGAFPEVVAVAALEQVGGGIAPSDLRVAGFSSRGQDDSDDSSVSERELEVAAPGRAIESTLNDGTYAAWDGTSMATPHISGLAARMWQGSAAATRAWLRVAGADFDITAADGGGAGPGFDEASGYGSARIR